jgi:Ras-related protein Rab-1A
MSYGYLFKIPLVGDGGIGKTSFVLRFVGGTFQQDYKMTIGVDFRLKLVTLPDGTPVKLQLWDTGGQARFTSVRSIYYKGSSGFVVMYDVTNRASFSNLDRWMDEVLKHVPDAEVLLIGNKSDLTDQKIISSAEGRHVATKYNALFAETSAKTGKGVNEAMAHFVEKLVKKFTGQRGKRVTDEISKMKRTVHPELRYKDEILLYELKAR